MAKTNYNLGALDTPVYDWDYTPKNPDISAIDTSLDWDYTPKNPNISAPYLQAPAPLGGDYNLGVTDRSMSAYKPTLSTKLSGTSLGADDSFVQAANSFNTTAPRDGTGDAIGGALDTVSAGANFIPVVGQVVSGVTKLASLGFQWYYANKNMKAQEKASEENKAFRAAQVAEGNRRWEENKKLTVRQLDEQDKQNAIANKFTSRKMDLDEYSTKEGIAMKKAEIAEANRVNGINQTIQIMMGTLNTFNTAASRGQDYNFWAARGKA